MVSLHAAHAARVGCNTIWIRTVDTDVVVLAVAYAAKICVHRYPFHAVSGCDMVSAFAGRGNSFSDMEGIP